MQINWLWLRGGQRLSSRKQHLVKDEQLLLQKSRCGTVPSILLDDAIPLQQNEIRDQETKTGVQRVYEIIGVQQSLHHLHKQRRYPIWLLLLLLLAATLLWVLNSVNIVQGVWATVLNAVFTGLSTIFTLLQWHAQRVQEGPQTTVLSIPEKAFPSEQFAQSIPHKRKGAIVVYTSRKWRGSTLHLVLGLQETTGSIEAAANLVERQIAGKRQFLCHFPAIPPGHYTIAALSKQRRVQVTVRPGHLSEIDWR